MNKQEFAQFTMALKTYYPRETLLPNSQAIDLWFNQLQDIPYKVAEAGLNKWVATNKWSPSIAEIRQICTEIVQGEVKDWGQAWDDVRMAVRLYGSYQQKEAMESFDELTRKAVKRIGYINICMSENVSTERANFRMIYQQLEERKRNDAMIPARLREMIQTLQIGAIEKGEANG